MSSLELIRSIEIQNKGDLNQKLLKFKEIRIIYEKTHIKPVYFLYILLLSMIIIIIGFFENIITCSIGIFYPLYFSIKSIKENDRKSIKDWLIYWIVFSFFVNFEFFFNIFFRKAPLYFFYKMLFLLICYLPQYKGALYLYYNLIRPLFNKYEDDVYRFSLKIKTMLQNTLYEDKYLKNIQENVINE